MSLKAKSLQCARGDTHVLGPISFEVPQGGALILRGPNGSGKTTLLKTLAGLLPAAGGSLQLDPEQAVFLGHANGVKAQLTVAENLRFWAALYDSGPIATALDSFGLAPIADRRAQHLSAGQKRRVGLARVALSHRPVWLLDEPTAALDASSKSTLTSAIAAHLDDGGLAVIATHDNLNIANATTLDIGKLKTPGPSSTSPFLDGAFA